MTVTGFVYWDVGVGGGGEEEVPYKERFESLFWREEVHVRPSFYLQQNKQTLEFDGFCV